MERTCVRLESVTQENWRTKLSVSPEQASFVADATTLLARAYAYREADSRAVYIYADETPVGMALYYALPDFQVYDFSQLFIDARWQGRGYGRAAAKLVLDEMRADGRYRTCMLCYIEGNEVAKQLYASLGFRETGERDGNEIEMRLDW